MKVLRNFKSRRVTLGFLIFASGITFPFSALAIEKAGIQKKEAVFSQELASAPQSLPPIRRVGVDLANSNVKDYRNFLRQSTKEPGGFPGLPLNENDTVFELTKAVETALGNTGRFWILSMSNFDKGFPTTLDAQEKNRLTGTYDLDGWLVPTVVFAPDHTLIRVALKSAHEPEILWAREDVLGPPQPSLSELQRLFETGVARLISTLGHDGALTWSRDDLVTVDFGSERGISKGEHLMAGFVLLSAFHPQTGEFLRSSRIDVMELEVIDAKKGAALCRIVQRNMLLEKEAARRMGKGGDATGTSKSDPLLVWRLHSPSSRQRWRNKDRTAQSPHLGSAEEGFSKEPEEVDQLEPVPVEAPPKPEDKPPSPEKTSPQQPDENPSENSELNFHLHSMMLGTGATFGILSTTRGDRNTDQPPLLLNTLNLGADIQLAPDLELTPRAVLSVFRGGDVTGGEFSVDVPLETTVWRDSSRSRILALGAGVGGIYGSVKTVRVVQPLTHFEVLGAGSYRMLLPGFGKFSVEANLSLFDILDGEIFGQVVTLAEPSSFFPKELGFFLRFKRGPKSWVEFQLGGQWKFGPFP
jgi:hypothetical protein